MLKEVGSRDHANIRWRTAIHEAGHLLADHIFRFGPWEVNLATARGAATYSCVVSSSDPRVAKQLAVSLLSGAAAERAAGFDDDETLAGQTSDQARVAGLNLSQSDLQECFEEARRLMSEHRDEILRIATELELRPVTRGPALHQLLGQPLPAGCWFGRVETLSDATVSSALITFDGEFEGVIDADVRVTAASPENADRLRALAGCPELFVTAFRSDEASCSASLNQIQHEKDSTFVLRPFRTMDW